MHVFVGETDRQTDMLTFARTLTHKHTRRRSIELTWH